MAAALLAAAAAYAVVLGLWGVVVLYPEVTNPDTHDPGVRFITIVGLGLAMIVMMLVAGLGVTVMTVAGRVLLRRSHASIAAAAAVGLAAGGFLTFLAVLTLPFIPSTDPAVAVVQVLTLVAALAGMGSSVILAVHTWRTRTPARAWLSRPASTPPEEAGRERVPCPLCGVTVWLEESDVCLACGAPVELAGT